MVDSNIYHLVSKMLGYEAYYMDGVGSFCFIARNDTQARFHLEEREHTIRSCVVNEVRLPKSSYRLKEVSHD
jgi:hypothetical protein